MIFQKYLGADTKLALRGHLGKKLLALCFYLFTVVPYLNQHPWQIVASATFLLMIGLFVKKWPKLINWLVALSCGFLVFKSYGALRGLEPGLSLLLFFSVLKTWELKKERDLHIMFLISMLLLVGHLLNLYSLMGLVHLLLCSFLMMLLMMMFHHEQSWQWPNRARLKSLGLVFLIAIPQAVFLFIFFPRFYVGQFNFSSTQMKSKLGFTDRLRPGEISEIINDTDPVFRVNFSGTKKPRGQDLYWRGATLSLTDGFNWDRGESWEVRNPNTDNELLAENDEDSFQYQIHFATQERGIGFTLANTYKVDLMGRGRVAYFDDQTYRLHPFSNSKMRYQAWSFANNAFVSPAALDELELKRYLQIPEELSEKFQAYIKEKFGHHRTPPLRARALMRYFRQENFVYTLRPDAYLGEGALEDFFFQKRRGFCEHYSSVTALAFRVLGIPTRVVTGFQGGLYNVYGDYFVIRGEDAHAWVEAYFEDQGWTRFDPVEHIAPHRIEFGARDYYLSLEKPESMTFQNFLDGQTHGLDRELLLRLDAYYFALNQAFISFDYDAQISAFKKWGLPELSPRHYLLISLAGSTLLALFFLPLTMRRKVFKDDELLKAMRPLLKKLRKKGLVRQPWLSVDQYLASLCQDSSWNPTQQEGLSKIFQLYQELRFKRPTQAADQKLETLKNLLKKLDLES